MSHESHPKDRYAPRYNYAVAAPGVYDAMDHLDTYLGTSGLEVALLHLVRLRASQLNGCAYCLDMHARDLEILGEPSHRIHALAAWRECPWYSDRERAALAWTEAVTLVSRHHLPEEDYQMVRSEFSEQEVANLTLAIAAINAWNRLSIAARLQPGHYRPAGTAP